jgi:hypothetical protein
MICTTTPDTLCNEPTSFLSDLNTANTRNTLNALGNSSKSPIYVYAVGVDVSHQNANKVSQLVIRRHQQQLHTILKRMPYLLKQQLHRSYAGCKRIGRQTKHVHVHCAQDSTDYTLY